MCYYVQRVSDHTEHRLTPISEASVLLQEYRCLFSVRFYKPMPIIEQKYQDCCAICFKIPLESARYCYNNQKRENKHKTQKKFQIIFADNASKTMLAWELDDCWPR